MATTTIQLGAIGGERISADCLGGDDYMVSIDSGRPVGHTLRIAGSKVQLEGVLMGMLTELQETVGQREVAADQAAEAVAEMLAEGTRLAADLEQMSYAAGG